MLLDIDAGNTRFKWRLCAHSGVVVASGACFYSDAKDIVSALSGYDVARVRLSSVVRDDKYEVLSQALAEVYGGDVESVKVVDGYCGLKLAYLDVGLLGVDRWLAMLGGREKLPDVDLLVVDLGSAVTLDLVSAEGTHLGGYIVPGINMLRGSLYRNTDQVKVIDRVSECLVPGCSTFEAVDHGSLRMLCSFIAAVCGEKPGRQLLLTGGDAELVDDLLDCSAVVIPDLVLDGISLALP